MDSESQACQPLSPQYSSYSDDASVPPSSICSSSSSSTATPEPDFDDQKARNKIIHHLVSKPKPKPKPKPKKQYQCPQCLKSFTRPSALQTHSYTHTAEKPFQCRSPNCGRSFSVVSNLRRHFKVHQKAAVGDKLSAEDRLRCVRNLMERSRKILGNKKQILPYSNIASRPHPAQHEYRKTSYPILQLPPQQPQPQHQYHLNSPDLNMNNDSFMVYGPHQNMVSPLGYLTSTSGPSKPMYWFSAPTPCTPSTNNGASTFGSNEQN
ncbi:hypothetical protein G6F42_019398 [Rhizopus arrhizus]|nr:hypothetical protein G6F42_019398 [Rhizopus arrhizus]